MVVDERDGLLGGTVPEQHRVTEPGDDGVPQPAGHPVLLPGRAGTSIMWAPNLAALAADRPVWTVDLIGESGRSEQTAPIRDAADQAAWLDAMQTFARFPVPLLMRTRSR